MKIPNEFLSEIRKTINLVDIVSETVSLKKTGHNWVGLCPFHSERSPSFTVHETKNLFHCHGCKSGGDLFAYVQKLHGLSFMESVLDLADRAKLKVPAGVGSDSSDPKVAAAQEAFRFKKSTAHKLNLFSAQFFRKQLSQNNKVQDYLTTRGVNAEEIRNFQIGYSPNEWEALSGHLAKSKAPMDLASELGLAKNSTKSNSQSGYFDLFRDRVMFPIINLMGHVQAFGGRALDKSEGPKFLNSQDSFLYKKSETLFGLFQAQKYIRVEDCVMVVEGYFDVVTLHSHGIRNVVAVCGTALTPQHLKLLRRLASRVIVLFDADRAGMDGANKAMLVGLESGFVVQGLILPTKQDPDEFVMSSGAEALKALMATAPALIDLGIKEQLELAKQSPQSKTVAIKKIKSWLDVYTDHVGVEVRWKEVETALGVSRQALFGRSSPQQPASIPIEAKLPLPLPMTVLKNRVLERFETILMTALIRWDEFGKVVLECRNLIPNEKKLYDVFVHSEAKALAEQLISEPGFYNQIKQAPEWVLEKLTDSALISVITQALVADRSPVNADQVRLAIKQGVKGLWARFSHELKIAIKVAESSQDHDLKEKLLKDYLDVQRKMKEFQGTYDQSSD
ncbi:MAG: DNA primase [Xanthomonadaceae bacterium]|nr:DNA primase [Xanthomonadaceae bacterium]